MHKLLSPLKVSTVFISFKLVVPNHVWPILLAYFELSDINISIFYAVIMEVVIIMIVGVEKLCLNSHLNRPTSMLLYYLVSHIHSPSFDLLSFNLINQLVVAVWFISDPPHNKECDNIKITAVHEKGKDNKTINVMVCIAGRRGFKKKK